MAQNIMRYKTLFLLTLGILVVFIGRTLLATAYPVPRLAELFDTITVIGSIGVCAKECGVLYKRDWVVSIVLGLLVGTGMCFATLFAPYPVFGIIKSNTAHALLRGTFTTLATLRVRKSLTSRIQAENGPDNSPASGSYLVFGP